MTLTRTVLGTLATTANGTTYSTGDAGGSGAVAGSPNQLIVAFVAFSMDTDTFDLEPSTNNSPWGIPDTWAVTDIQPVDTLSKIAVVRGTTGAADPGSDTFAFDLGAPFPTMTGCMMYIQGFTDSSGNPPTAGFTQAERNGAASEPAWTGTGLDAGPASWYAAAFICNRNPPAAAP